MAMEGEACIASTSTTVHQKRGISSFISRLCCALSSLKEQPEKKRKPTLLRAPHDTPLALSTRAKSVEFDRVFHYFDADGDGKISPTELRDCLRTMGEELSLPEAEALVQSADSDGDGLLGFHDFVTLVDAQGEEDKGRSLKEAFEVYEMKGQGCITPKSLRRALCKLGEPRSLEECKVMIRRFDRNGDGVISFEEFKIMMR